VNGANTGNGNLVKEEAQLTEASEELWAMLWPAGLLELPPEAQAALGIEGGWQCRVEIVNGAMVIRPEEAIPAEDLWAYTREHIARVQEARAEPGGFALTERQLRRMIKLWDRHGLDGALRIVLGDNRPTISTGTDEGGD
jgi:hypothetical protein